MSHMKNNESGFTLIEVLVAVLVLAIGLASAAAMQTRAVNENNNAARLAGRVAGAELVMEDLMNRIIVPTDDDVDDIFIDPDGDWQDMPTGTDYQTFTATYRVNADTPLNNLMTIDVVATPRGMSSQYQEKRKITFSYIRSARFN